MTLSNSPATDAEMRQLLAQTRARIEDLQSAGDDRIAVIGMAGRFPGADNTDDFLALLRARQSGLQSVSADDLVAAGRDPKLLDDPGYVAVWGGPPETDGFDAGFFGYAPREAELMDPQQRMFLDCAWTAIEDAGQGGRTGHRVGVYAGASLSSHLLRTAGRADAFDAGLANIGGMVAARTSFHLDLTGPSVGVQTTCSSALVAVHQAAAALRQGDCDMALAGAVAVHLARPEGYRFQKDGIAAPDGQCRPFAAEAAGTVFASGAGVVVLKRLRDALADGDRIDGVLLGSAVNNDGAGKIGMTAPSVTGQADVLTSALRSAGLTADALDYVEAHGTGTALGDPVEVSALNRAFGADLIRAGRRCLLGSVKGNTGHLDAAAGMAGLIKVLLAFRDEALPGTAHFAAPNPACNFGNFDVLGDGVAWPRHPDRLRRAGISAFGIGGTNAHVIMEEPPTVLAREVEAAPQLLPVSAATETALAALRGRLADRLERGDLSLQDVAYTLQTGRKTLAARHVLVARDTMDAIAQLRADATPVADAAPGKPEVVFAFSGQSSQRAGMAQSLYSGSPAFRAALDACLSHLPERDTLRRLLLNPTKDDDTLIHETGYAQPALFAVEYALAQHWLSLGVQPVACMGHSVGELTAAAVTGVLSLDDACHLVAARGAAMQGCPRGAMLAVALSEKEAEGALPDGVDVAAVNGPRSVVLAGPIEAISALARWFDRSGVGCRRLHTSHGFHSAMMDPALDPFRAGFEQVTLSPPTIPMLSNVTGDWMTEAQACDPGYWVQHLRQPVRFGDGVKQVLELDAPVLLEIGPGAGLARMARQQMRKKGRAVASMPCAGDAAVEVLAATGDLWAAGVAINWRALHEGQVRPVSLPGYPFERQSFWLPPAETMAEATVVSENPEDWVYQPVWSRLPIGAAKGGKRMILGASALPDAQVASGDVAVTAAPGAEHAINPEDPAEYRALFEAHSDVDEVVVAWGLGQPDGAARRLKAVAALAAALADVDYRPQVTILGMGMEQVTGREPLDPNEAALLGIAPVLAHEVPGLVVRSLDIEASARLPPLTAASKDSRRLAVRSGRLWAMDHVRTPLPSAETIPPDGPVLIVGDLLNGLAEVYAAGIRRDWQVPVILAGTGLPPRADWPTWLRDHSAADPVSRVIKALQTLDPQGVGIDVLAGNETDAAWLDAALTEAEARLGPICGVIQTAAMGDVTTAPLSDPASALALIATRRRGLRALRHVLAKRAVRFCLAQSSLSVLAGGVGFAAHAASSAAVETEVALAGRDGATAWQSVAWDAAETGSLGDISAVSQVRLLTGAQVWERSRAILGLPGLSHAVITPADLNSRLRPVSAMPSPEPRTEIARKGPFIAPRDEIEAAVAQAMTDMLGLREISVEDNFFELGGHSLLAIQIINRLRGEFAVELPVRALLYEVPTAAGIAAAIRKARDEAESDADLLEGLLDEFDADTKEATG